MKIDFIEPDNNRAIEYLYGLLNLAEMRTEKLGIPFKREDYKWVLGARVITDIDMDTNFQRSLYPDQPRTLFGVVVEADFHNPDNVQLWENITNKV